MPVRATKRGSARTPLSGSWDVLVCGASFAGLAVARELRGSGARVLIVDRYEIGERQTSACAAPTEWLEALALGPSIRQTFRDLVIHTPSHTFRWRLPWTFSTFDYRELCALLRAQGDAQFETAKVDGRTGFTVHTDRGDLTAPLIVDALGWRRVLSRAQPGIQPPEARLSRGLEVHPHGTGADLELWLDPAYVRAGYSWSFPARDELRVGVGSFDPRDHVKEPTVRLAGDLDLPAVGYQGNWIPHQMRRPVEDGIFFAGDSAGHCLPTTAEGIRTALYFGIACGRELRAVVDGRRDRTDALARYAAFCDGHERAFRWLLRVQGLVSRVNPTPLMTPALRLMDFGRFVDWSFGHYLRIAPPSFARASAAEDAPPAGEPPAGDRLPAAA
jgi:digeranylgeranylglycerophospholipid reductase